MRNAAGTTAFRGRFAGLRKEWVFDVALRAVIGGRPAHRDQVARLWWMG